MIAERSSWFMWVLLLVILGLGEFPARMTLRQAALNALAAVINRSSPSLRSPAGRARNIAVGAIDAAIACLGLEDDLAVLAVVEPLAGVGGHGFGLGVAAVRTAQGRSQFDACHVRFRVMFAANAGFLGVVHVMQAPVVRACVCRMKAAFGRDIAG
jgi:hypothetical protein